MPSVCFIGLLVCLNTIIKLAPPDSFYLRDLRANLGRKRIRLIRVPFNTSTSTQTTNTTKIRLHPCLRSSEFVSSASHSIVLKKMLKGHSLQNTPTQSNLISIFQFVPHRNPSSYSGRNNPAILNLFINIKIGRIPFHGRT